MDARMWHELRRLVPQGSGAFVDGIFSKCERDQREATNVLMERDRLRQSMDNWAKAWRTLQRRVANLHSEQPAIDPAHPRHRKEWDQALDEVEALMEELDPWKSEPIL